MNKFGFVIFLTVFTLIYVGLHYFVYRQIVKGLELTGRELTAVRILFAAMGALYYLMLFMRHRFTLGPLLYLGAIWFGAVAIGFSFFLVKAAVTVFIPQLTRQLTIGTLVLAILAIIGSLVNAARPPRLKEITIPLSGLPAQLEGFTIVQLSDLHLGSLTSTARMEKMVHRVNALNPDLVVITGDIIDQKMDTPNAFSDLLRSLHPPHGVLAVTGNHDYYSGVDKFMTFCEAAGLRALRNEHITVADALEVAGIDDHSSRRMTGRKPNLKTVLEPCDRTRPIILLAHQPDIFGQAVQLGVDLQLSGHTHAGQIPPLDIIVHLRYRYPWGLYRQGNAYIYTTSGSNTWGPPMRLSSVSEIVKITLTR